MPAAKQEVEVLEALYPGREVGLMPSQLINEVDLELDELNDIVNSLIRKKEIRALKVPLTVFYIITAKGRKRIGVA